VFSAASSTEDAIARKQQAGFGLNHIHTVLDVEGQRMFVRNQRCGVKRFDELVKRKQAHLAAELYKYCALQKRGGVWVDMSSPLLVRLEDVVKENASMAVLGGAFSGGSIHGSFLLLRREHAHIAKTMLQLMIETSIKSLEASPMLLTRKLYSLIAESVCEESPHSLQTGWNGDWFLLEQKCQVDALLRLPIVGSSQIIHECSGVQEFCCSIHHEGQQMVMLSRYPFLPYQKITEPLSQPIDASHGAFRDEQLPYVSNVAVKAMNEKQVTPNLHDIFEDKQLMPSPACLKCLHQKTCVKYDEICEEYLGTICSTHAPPKVVTKELTVTPPLYRRDPSRLIPRIIHQTWYEDLTKEDYPNMSRLKESFRQSGWEYKFYSDADAEEFLLTHFPPEVLEAYKALIPGAFKADLFRYCALLIYGGVYADVDIVLESKLDISIEPDIGFMVPMDEPDACVWQGLIAAAPGHPFLAKAIETVVNQVRNRYTTIDIDASYCPDPHFKVLHTFDVLFTAGPCLLGASINRVLGRYAQEIFEPGELFPEARNGTSFVKVMDGYKGAKIPGRTVMLKQNKWDMSAHRFTNIERGLIVAGTDLENSDDRQNRKLKKQAEEDDQDEESGKKGGEHYSKAHAKTGIYGVAGLYVDQERANEEIKIWIDATRLQKMASSIPTTTKDSKLEDKKDDGERKVRKMGSYKRGKKSELLAS
jgi:mannosyltransferase OCH1-like enzyme